MSPAKRAFDIIISAAGLVALSPVMIAAAVMVKLEDGGPVFFRQERVGRGFRPFHILKFRTMTVGAQAEGPAITSGGDPRVTRAGVFLRKTKVDELPQLINVLKGDMSIVGPRPEVPKYVETFREQYSDLLKFRPGITDYASIKYRDEESVLAGAEDAERMYLTELLPRKLELSLEYTRRAGLVEDVRIIIRTLISL